MSVDDSIHMSIVRGASQRSRALFAAYIKPEKDESLPFTGSIEMYYDQQQIGALGFMIIDDMSYIRAIAIDKSWRKRGYGSMLLQYSIEFLTHVYPMNEVVLFADRFKVPWYKKQGFSLIPASLAKTKDWYAERREYRFNPVMKFNQETIY